MYTDVSSFPSVRGEGGRADSRRREPTQLFEDRGVCDELGTTGMALLNRRQVWEGRHPLGDHGEWLNTSDINLLKCSQANNNYINFKFATIFLATIN